jgi:hypothetical protein
MKIRPLKFLISKDNSGGSKRFPLIRASGYFYDNPKKLKWTALSWITF